jgi:hypothetical protein
MIAFLNTIYIHTTRNYRQYSTIAIPRTFQFTVAHALGFSIFTSRILATDLSQSHCHFKSHMESSFHSLIHFFPLFCRCWSLPAQSFSGPSPFELATIFCCLRFETSIFVASYDSQGLSLSLMLRPTVSRPVYLGIKHPFGAYDQRVITV